MTIERGQRVRVLRTMSTQGIPDKIVTVIGLVARSGRYMIQMADGSRTTLDEKDLEPLSTARRVNATARLKALLRKEKGK